MKSTVIVLVIAAIACNPKPDFDEQTFVEKHVRELKTALAARNESHAITGCIVVTGTGLDRMPKPLIAEIEQLCYVDEPRLLLENAVAGVKREGTSEFRCMQLFAGEAFKTLAEHPTTDRALRDLVDEYTRLCPAEVAKFHSP
jgi:hypothetical protein